MTEPSLLEEVQAELSRPDRSLQAARSLLDQNFLEDSLSRAYYAILHAARAACLLKGFRSHHIDRSAVCLVSILSRLPSWTFGSPKFSPKSRMIDFWPIMTPGFIPSVSVPKSA